jgi:hypothetical protein
MTQQPEPGLADLLDRLVELGDPARPPHPDGRPCDALCVPACVATVTTRPTGRPITKPG